jgi:membrane protein
MDWQRFTHTTGWQLFKTTWEDWSDDKAPRLGASLAYYAVFSLVPLLVLITAVVGMIFGRDAVEGALDQQLSQLLGDSGAEGVREMVTSAQHPARGTLASIVGAIALVFGASGVFAQLQDALNTIWEVEPKPNRGLLGMLKDRVFSFAMVLGSAFLLLVSLALSAALATLGNWMQQWLPGPEWILHAVEFITSLAVITLLFALIFKLVPDIEIRWNDVWIGAFVTALLFTFGKFALGLYLGRSSVSSSYGAAGAVMIVLLWVYYSSQILFFGAEFTQAYARLYGSRVRPAADAQPIRKTSRLEQGLEASKTSLGKRAT